MPWTLKQMKSIRARAHGWKGPGAFQNVGPMKAKMMESEGIRKKIVKRRERQLKG